MEWNPATDEELLERAYQEDRILVTSNVGDFEKLATARDIHAGIVLVERAGLLRDEPIALVRQAADALVKHDPMINEVLRVSDDGSMAFETMPAPKVP